MALTPSAAKYVKKKLDTEHNAYVRAEAARALVKECDEVLARVRAAAARVKKRGPRSPGPSREDRRKEEAKARIARLAEIRVELHRETGGTCVVCGLGLPFARMHAHHILSGPERQIEERQDTMAPCHEKCHDWLHGKAQPLDPRDALVALAKWCDATGRTLAFDSTMRRIGKIDEASASKVTP